MLLQVMVGNSFILMSHSRKFRSHLEKIWSFLGGGVFYLLERLRLKKEASACLVQVRRKGELKLICCRLCLNENEGKRKFRNPGMNERG